MARSLEKSPARTLSSMVVLSRMAASVDGHLLLRLVHSSISVWEQTRTPVSHKQGPRLTSASGLTSIFSSTYISDMPSATASLKGGKKPRGHWTTGGRGEREVWQHGPASMDDLEIWF